MKLDPQVIFGYHNSLGIPRGVPVVKAKHITAITAEEELGSSATVDAAALGRQFEQGVKQVTIGGGKPSADVDWMAQFSVTPRLVLDLMSKKKKSAQRNS